MSSAVWAISGVCSWLISVPWPVMNLSRFGICSRSLVVLITIAAALVSPEHLLVLCDGAVLAIAILLFWPSRDAPVLLLPFGLQWLAVAMKPIETALTGQPFDGFGELGQS